MLHFEMRAPHGVENGAPVLVLLHGRGSHERDLLGLGEALLPEAIVVCPRAPFSGAPWGYGPGWAWYRFLGGNRPEAESFEHSRGALDELLEALPTLLPARPGPVLLGGFSQGGTLSLGYALQRRDRVAGVLNFSGFLADHPGVERGMADAGGLQVFWGHGTADPNIPFPLAVEGRERLTAVGVEVEARDYDIGHWIDAEEVNDAAAWSERVLAGERRDIVGG